MLDKNRFIYFSEFWGFFWQLLSPILYPCGTSDYNLVSFLGARIENRGLLFQEYGFWILIVTASGNASMVNKLAEGAERDGKNNVAFMSYFLQGK